MKRENFKIQCPGRASIHRINRLAPLKPSLTENSQPSKPFLTKKLGWLCLVSIGAQKDTHRGFKFFSQEYSTDLLLLATHIKKIGDLFYHVHILNFSNLLKGKKLRLLLPQIFQPILHLLKIENSRAHLYVN